MQTSTRASRPFELDLSEEAILASAVVSARPDADVAPGDMAWWLSRQEAAETRAALAEHGLL